jgi:hypothetical protein
MATKVVPGVDPFRFSCLACKLDVDDLLDIIYFAKDIYAAEHDILRKGLKINTWFNQDGMRMTRVILSCGAYLEYGSYLDGYMTITEMSCVKFPGGP